MSVNAASVSRHAPFLSVKRWLFPLLARPRIAHTIKYVVYVSLIANFGAYVVDDYLAFRSALPPDAPLSEVVIMFATSIDAFAWIALVFLFELETYALPDEAFTNWLSRLILSIRIVCYVLIAYAAYGYTAEAIENYDFAQVPGVDSLCVLADRGVALQVDVIKYVDVTAANCASLSDDDVFYQIAGEVSVIGAATLAHVQHMGWVDICNAFVWLLVVFLIEIEIRMQSADRFGGTLLNATRQAKTLLYLVLIGNGIIWFFNSYYLYTWDAFLWIFGFWAIELNLAEWEIDRVQAMGAT